MKSSKILLIALVLLNIAYATAGGVGGTENIPGGVGGTEGGGTPCDQRIETVRQELYNWVESNAGMETLKLHDGWSYLGSNTEKSYRAFMLAILSPKKVILSCKKRIIKKKSAITVGGIEKMCKNFINKNGSPQISCDQQQLMQLNVISKDFFQLIHHEFASLVGVEVKDGSAHSDWFVSSQIDRYGHYEQVWILGQKAWKKVTGAYKIATPITVVFEKNSGTLFGEIESYFNQNMEPIEGRVIPQKLESSGLKINFEPLVFGPELILNDQALHFYEESINSDLLSCQWLRSNVITFNEKVLENFIYRSVNAKNPSERMSAKITIYPSPKKVVETAIGDVACLDLQHKVRNLQSARSR